MKEQFKMVKMRPSELLGNKNEFFSLLNPSDVAYYAREALFFSHYELPVVSRDNVLLSHVEDVEAAFSNGDEPLDVLVANSMNENSYLRFCLKTIQFKNLSSEERQNLVFTIEKHLKSPAGEEWNKSLEKAGYTDINKKCGAILNYSSQSIKLLRNGHKTNEAQTITDLSILEFSFQDTKAHIKYNGTNIDTEAAHFQIKEHNGTVTIKFKISKYEG